MRLIKIILVIFLFLTNGIKADNEVQVLRKSKKRWEFNFY